MYTTATKVRYLANVTTTEVSDDTINGIITQVDSWIDWKVDMAGTYQWEEFEESLEEDRFLTMKKVTSFDSINKIIITGKELFQFDKDNLINNPEVDEEGDTADAPLDWDSAGSTATMSWSTDYSKTGRYSLEIDKTGSGTDYWFSDAISITAGYTYKIKGWIKTVSLTGGTGAWIRINWLDENGDSVGTDDSSKTTGSEDWTEVSKEATAPYDAVECEIQLMSDDSSGNVYFDRFFFSRRRWTYVTSTAEIEFDEFQINKRIQVEYAIASSGTSPIIERLSTILSARDALLNAVGGTATGTSYTVDGFNINKGGASANKLKLIDNLNNQAVEIIDEIDNDGMVNTDYLLVNNAEENLEDTKDDIRSYGSG